MIEIHLDERADQSASRLAELLTSAPADPMTPEWIAVPSAGIRRWLELELARHLGASSAGSGDGIAANIDFVFPGALRSQVLGRDDAWSVDHLAWAVLSVIDEHRDDPLVRDLLGDDGRSARYATARRIADLFDRYHLHRPDMVQSWADSTDLTGTDLDGTGRPLGDHDRWQAHLWRLVRARLHHPGPTERLPGLIDRIRAGELELDLPPRLILFGLTVLPGGPSFLELADAVATRRDVHLFLLEPSSASNRRITGSTPPAVGARLRSEDRSADLVHHPLLRSWGRLPRETAIILDDAGRDGPSIERTSATAPTVGPATTLLAALQEDLRSDRAPTGDRPFDPSDGSIQFHACHGPARQVEVLRDALLHLLADGDLLEEDIVVMCPALERFAPLIESGFGPSAVDGSAPADDSHAPTLRYRLADRSIGSDNQVLDATRTLLEMLSGRFEAPTVLDFLARQPVRARFDLSDDDLARIGDWAADGRVRWGLDADHRAASGMPTEITTNTWRAAIDRLLVGSAIHDEALAVGEVVPLPVGDGDAGLAGRLAEVMWRLSRHVDEIAVARPVRRWLEWLNTMVTDLFEVDREGSWQLRTLRRILADIAESSSIDGEPIDVEIDFADLRSLLDDRLRSMPGRPDFFRGGITVTSTTPLRWVPFRVIALLGMDQEALASGAVEGDDLVAAAPCLGDRDPRADLRQSLLEAVLAAGDHLLVVRDGHSPRTNQPVPAPVAVAELHDAVIAMMRHDDRDGATRVLEVHHPRQGFDDRCLRRGALVAHADAPWSFDPSALADARARRSSTTAVDPVFLAAPLDAEPFGDITLTQLHSFLRKPVQWFLDQRLRVRLPQPDEALDVVMPTQLGGLDRWKVGDRLLQRLLEGGTVEEWVAIERRLGFLPPGALGDASIDSITTTAGHLVQEATRLGFRPGPGAPIPVDVTLTGGVRITGIVEARLDPSTPGPARVGFAEGKPSDHVAAWLDLMVLTAHDPATEWRSVSVHRGHSDKKPPESMSLTVVADDPSRRREIALHALEVVVELLRYGMREPIPLFTRLSPAVAMGEAKRSMWIDHDGRGDASDAANAVVYGAYDYDDLLAIPAREGDPPGSGNRVARFAHRLWDEIHSSTTP